MDRLAQLRFQGFGHGNKSLRRGAALSAAGLRGQSKARTGLQKFPSFHQTSISQGSYA
jgi:hypothetical protein